MDGDLGSIGFEQQRGNCCLHRIAVQGNSFWQPLFPKLLPEALIDVDGVHEVKSFLVLL